MYDNIFFRNITALQSAEFSPHFGFMCGKKMKSRMEFSSLSGMT